MLIDGGAGHDWTQTGVGAKRAEDLGYDGAWVPETSHDPFLQLGAAAVATERILLGTNIAVAFARNPMTLAVSANDLHWMSKGRMVLGLGSQIKPHIEKRFSMPWSSPAARMREFILAMRHIWSCWNEGTKLEFRGDFYTHTLMNPFFNPGPNPYGTPKVFVAGVGELMTEAAGETCDGFLAHGFTTERYLKEVTIPALHRGMAKSGREAKNFQVSLPSFVVTGRDEKELEAAKSGTKAQIAFYGSTPAYRGVLELHGWGDLQDELNTLSKQGKWVEMGQALDDEVLDAFAVVAEPTKVASELTKRFGGVVDRLSFYMPYQVDEAITNDLLGELKASA
jgi:probable F420-dependent oxidoreductase